MPYVDVQITKGATKEQKAQIIKDITQSLVKVLGKKPEHTHVVLRTGPLEASVILFS